ncbi:MAG: fibronectin type III domain-containing protein [Solirubrobacteraceae bacterium]|nr:fibronectin type III domain-containing protein [Solirubrobacteraceae bacterium]
MSRNLSRSFFLALVGASVLVGAQDAAAAETTATAGPPNIAGQELGLPSAPPEVRLLSVDDRSVFLQWDASTDVLGIKDYDVYQDGVKVKTVTTPQSSVTGLRSETAYSFQVRANAVDGRTSELSPALAVTTEEPRWASATYTCKIGPFGTRTVRVAIEPTFPRKLAANQSVAATNAGMRIEFDSVLADLLSEAVTLETGDQPLFNRFRFEQTGSSTESGRTFEAPVTVPPTPIVPGSELQLNATAAMPSISAPAAGIYLFGDLVLQLIARDENGDAFRLDIPGIDGGGIDSDPNTFEMRCSAPPVIFEGPMLAWVLWDDSDVLPPTKPINLTGTATTSTVNLSWGASTDNVGVVGYDVYQGDRKVARVTGTTATVSGLVQGTAYGFRVVAVDAAGGQTSSDPIMVSTQFPVPPPPPPFFLNTLAGSATLKTLTKGTLPLKGSLRANLSLATGSFSADLTLADTQGRLTALGFLPVTAKIGFVPSGKTTGTLLDGVLSSNSKVRIKVKEVKLFGSIPLAGGNNCQTKSLSDINLRSTGAFTVQQGGNLAGTFAISDLNGCGVLNGLVSPLTAGSGNTITLKLTPAA